ncbi:TetR/AcrR family transcriptional regulator [Caulobacter sp. KR2-114]|uniref:TetR/AcrR family transcriptional regulator n=1 Tax=Caulobacter sp. KR2-114 TaxID=3400912 RepID=UPI003C1281E7
MKKRARAAAATKTSSDRRTPAPGGNPETYEKLVRAAGELLGEVGFEKLTTNAISAKVGMTPPAFYRYFTDKYEILEVLAQRLLKKQNDAYAVWLFEGGTWSNLDRQAESLEEWFRIAAGIVANEPGALWTMRALRALPNLAHVRLESQRMNTDRLFEFYSRVFPQMDPQLLWYRLRVRAEFGWVVDELALEEDRLPHDALFKEAARLLGRSLLEGTDLPNV